MTCEQELSQSDVGTRERQTADCQLAGHSASNIAIDRPAERPGRPGCPSRAARLERCSLTDWEAGRSLRSAAPGVPAQHRRAVPSNCAVLAAVCPSGDNVVNTEHCYLK